MDGNYVHLGGRGQRLMEEAIKNVYIFLAPVLALQGHLEISQVFGTKM